MTRLPMAGCTPGQLHVLAAVAPAPGGAVGLPSMACRYPCSSMSWACSWTWGGYLAAVDCERTHMTVLHCLRMLPSTWSMVANLGRPLLLLPSSTLLR